MSNLSRALNVTAFCLALFGAVCCGLLLGIHAQGEARGWIGSVCGGEYRACEQVIQSRWGVLPPTELEASGKWRAAESGRVPVAAVGLFYFSFLTIWFAAVGLPNGKQRRAVRVSFVLFCALGAAISAFYVCVMALLLETWCPLCVASQICNFLILALTVGSLGFGHHLAGLGGSRLVEGKARFVQAMSGISVANRNAAIGESRPPRRAGPSLATHAAVSNCSNSRKYYEYSGCNPARPPEDGQTRDDLGLSRGKESDARGGYTTLHRSVRYVVVVVLFALATCWAEWNAYRVAVLASIADYARELRRDGEYLELTHFRQTQYALNASASSGRGDTEITLNVRADDPMILPSSPGYGHTLVVFSDVECPSCARFDRFVDERIRPLYEGHLRVIYKHNPIPRIHPNAMRAAQALEAARLQGKFWEMREILRENRRRLSALDYRGAAAQLSLDVDRFVADMNSRVVMARINADRKAASMLQSRSTPDVFLSGRRVDPKIRDLLAFWRARADSLKSKRLQEGQGWGEAAYDRLTGRSRT